MAFSLLVSGTEPFASLIVKLSTTYIRKSLIILLIKYSLPFRNAMHAPRLTAHKI